MWFFKQSNIGESKTYIMVGASQESQALKCLSIICDFVVFFYMIMCVCICIYIYTHAHIHTLIHEYTMEHLWEPEESFWQLASSFHSVGLRDQIQVSSLVASTLTIQAIPRAV